MEDSVAIPQGSRNRNSIWPSDPITGYIPKGLQIVLLQRHMQRTCMFVAALFTIAKTLNQPKCPSMIDCIGKMWHIYTMEYYAAIKNDEFVSFVGTWSNLENIILSKVTQEQKMKYHIFSLIGGWGKIKTPGHREGSTKHWGLLGGKGEGQQQGELGRDSLGRNAKCGWRGGRQQNTLPYVYLWSYLACSAQVLQNLKCK